LFVSDTEFQLSVLLSTTARKYMALADYCAMGSSEVTMHEGDSIELLKIGCAGWWFVKVAGRGNSLFEMFLD
jgi:SH3 domain